MLKFVVTMPVNFSFIICDFGLTSIHCKNKKQRKNIRVHGRFKKEKKEKRKKQLLGLFNCFLSSSYCL